MSAAEGELAVIRVPTRFATLDELVARPAVVVTGDIITVAATALPAVGERRRFQVLLADGTPVLEGLGEVATGKRLRIIELDAASRPVHERILAARKPLPLPRPSGSRAAPPPYKRTLEGPPSPAAAAEVAPPPPAPAEPPPPVTAAPAPVPAPDDDEPLPPLGWQLPPWLRSRRVQIGLGVAGAILLIGLVAALAGDDEPPATPAPVASAERVDAGLAVGPPPPDAEPAPTEPEPEAAPAEVDVEDAEEPPPPTRRKREPKKTAKTEPKTEKKKSATGRQVRLAVKSNPPGASIRVDGRPLDGGSVMVAAGSTVKVTATKRGYRRLTRSIDVGKNTSIVLKLEEM
jgi:hypothetical protein